MGSISINVDEMQIKNTTGQLSIFELNEAEIEPLDSKTIIANITNQTFNNSIQEVIIESKNCPETARDIYPGEDVNYMDCY